MPHADSLWLIMLGTGAIIHILICLTQWIWRPGANFLLGGWLALSWAAGIFRAFEVRRNPLELYDTWASVVWGQIVVVSVLVLANMLWRVAQDVKRDGLDAPAANDDREEQGGLAP